MVSEPGVLVTISFIALAVGGTSLLNLYNVGITDESGYVSVIVYDGNVTIPQKNQPPTVSAETPTNGSMNVTVAMPLLSASIQDPEGNLFNWSVTTSPNIGSTIGTNASNGTKSCNISGLQYSTTYYWTVACYDRESGQWTNHSYRFTTTTLENPGGEDPPGGGENPSPGGGGSDPEQNHPPANPQTPTGPAYVERGVAYSYLTRSWDADGDRVRYKFNWGDGTESNWTEYAPSNTSMSMSHVWNAVTSYSVKVIAQDEEGANSSQSPALIVLVSEVDNGGQQPVLDVNVSNNVSKNQTVFFDASGSFDPDGALVSYFWEFGDGTTGTGKTPSHTYAHPGEYTVTLTVTDSNGNTYQKTYTFNVVAGTEETANANEGTAFPIMYIMILGLVLMLIGGLVVVRMKRLLFLRERETRSHGKIARLDVEIARLTPDIHKTPVTPRNTNDEKSNRYASDERTLEQEVDDIILSKIREKIDKI
jgi:chitodextrinase